LAGASQIPRDWASATAAATAEFAKNRKTGDTASYANTSNAAANDSITVTATRQAPTYFTRIFGFMGVTITATARATVSSFTTVHSNQDIMPWGVMKDTYIPGQPYDIYTDNSSSNNGALSLPYVNNANCPVPNGANPYRDEIDGSERRSRAFGQVGGQSVFTHGVEVGVNRNERHDLPEATRDFIQLLAQGNRRLSQKSDSLNAIIDGRRALQTPLENVSDASGEPEVIQLFTTKLRDGTLFYVIGVAPEQEYRGYEGTFQQVVRSIKLND